MSFIVFFLPSAMISSSIHLFGIKIYYLTFKPNQGHNKNIFHRRMLDFSENYHSVLLKPTKKDRMGRN